ncbi:MAG: hypothetical protein PHI63_02765, partial [Patescibacteria group bacterium]|nr:hypothetical protein [Patescibacteria group bacterium]
AWEVWKFLWGQKAEASEIFEVLDSLVEQGKIERVHGYYCLSGRSEIIHTRWQRYLLAEPKYKRALRTARFLRFVPSVLTVAVCNNLAYSNGKAESDIDLFIIVRRGRIWLTRLLVTAVVQLLGLRRHGKKVTDRCCLSFYLTDEHLDISDLALPESDPYLYYWISTLAPIYDREGTFEKFWQANAKLLQHIPNAHPKFVSHRRNVGRIFSHSRAATKFGGWLDASAKRLQQRKMKHRPAHPSADTSVVISDSILKFHEEDRRELFRKQWMERSAQFLPLHGGE